jgi:hypothetical protein
MLSQRVTAETGIQGTRLEARMARVPDTFGGPEPDEQGTDVFGGEEPDTAASDEFGGPEPDEQGTDLFGRPG